MSIDFSDTGFETQEPLVTTSLTRDDENEGSLRPEILIAALDQALRGLKPGVDAEIVSTGIQQLTAIDTYQVERVDQRIVTKGDIETQPLDGEFDAPEGSLLHRSLSEVLSNL